MKKEYEEFKTKYTLLEEQNKKINEDYNKLKQDFEKRQSTMQLTKIIDEPDESHTNTIEIITEKIIIEENKEPTTTNNNQENKGPSKFKKAVTFSEPPISTKITENKILGNIETKPSEPSSIQSNEVNNAGSKETKQSSFMNKIKMFSNAGIVPTNTKPILKTKMSEEVKKVTMATTAKKEATDKAKEQRMNKALQRIKKKREKSEDVGTAKHDTNNAMFKSIRIKNMAELLEGQLNQNAQQAAEGNNENNANDGEEIKKEDITKKEEEENIDKMFDMIKRKSLLKRKKTKKTFEE